MTSPQTRRRRAPGASLLIAALAGIHAILAATACDGDLRFPGSDASSSETSSSETSSSETDAPCGGSCSAKETCDPQSGFCLLRCEPSNTSANSAQACALPTDKCEPTLGICVECHADGECIREQQTKLCNAVGRCVDCRSSADCVLAALPICGAQGRCERAK